MEMRSNKNIRIGDVLKEFGYVTDDDIGAAIEYQKTHEGVRLGGALIAMNIITEKQMLEALKTRPVTPDEDCPELTDDQLNRLAELAQQRREERNKQTVTLRLSPQALRTAKSLGKGYTSVLSRILEGALADGEIIKHYL